MTSAESLMTPQPTSTNAANGAPTSPAPRLDPMEVGWQFVQEYYTILNKDPDRLHCFYNKQSIMLNGEEGETVKQCLGQKEIYQAIKGLELQDSKVVISNMDSQASLNNGILISVLGEMETKYAPSRKFSQCFFLAEQPNGYFVLNDIFRFLKEDYEEEPAAPQNGSAHQEVKSAPPAPVVEKPAVSKPHVVEKPVAKPPVTEKVVPQPEKVVEKRPEPPVAEVKKPVPRSASPPKVLAQPPTPAEPEVPVEKPTKVAANLQKAANPEPRGPKTWASLAETGKERWSGQVSEVKGQTVPSTGPSQPASTKTEAPKVGGGKSEKPEKFTQRPADAELSVYIRGFTKATKIPQIKEEFAKIIGPVKWVEIVSESTGYLEFPDPELIKKALKVGQITVGSETVIIEEKGPSVRRFRGSQGKPGSFQKGGPGKKGPKQQQQQQQQSSHSTPQE